MVKLLIGVGRGVLMAVVATVLGLAFLGFWVVLLFGTEEDWGDVKKPVIFLFICFLVACIVGALDEADTEMQRPKLKADPPLMPGVVRFSPEDHPYHPDRF